MFGVQIPLKRVVRKLGLTAVFTLASPEESNEENYYNISSGSDVSNISTGK
jgi:hypothetical protein